MQGDPRLELVETVKAMYAAFNRRDVDAALAYMHPDVELRPAGTAARTGRAVYRGHDGIRAYFADVARVWPGGLEVSPASFRAVAGSVVAFGSVHGATAQQHVDDEVVWVWRLRDGLVASGQMYSTRAGAVEAARARR
ncbi:MAG TPA: nuclear transport factor 2 family protein [Capillimicrobium sp.]|nr:nuclear transport factor 2 family protein [Capillimicrobium sp.]